jgi:hypothetical protein
MEKAQEDRNEQAVRIAQPPGDYLDSSAPARHTRTIKVPAECAALVAPGW